jgi:hydroxyacylglutathione hydrolase
MLLYQRYTSGLAILSYVLADEQAGQAVVVDPVRDVDDYIGYAEAHHLRISHILETHVHADFVSGSRELKARLDGGPTICCSALGGPEWTAAYADHKVQQGDSLQTGSIRLDFLRTPGHTPEHVAINVYDTSRSSHVPWLMFTGDLLFVGAVGRPDLLGEQVQKRLAHDLYETLFTRLADVPDITEIYPGHGAGSLCGKAIASRRSSTLGFERRFSDSLQKKPEDQWVADLLADMPPAPRYFPRMKQVNRNGPALLGPTLPGLKPCSIQQVRQRRDAGCLVLDVRSKEAFAAAHVPGAINIGLADSFATWAGSVLPYDRDMLLILERPNDMTEVAIQLTRIGLDRLVGYIDGGMEAWESAGQPLQTLATLSVQDLHRRLDEVPDKLTVLDVRTNPEWAAGHIDGAIHVPGQQLQDSFAKVPKDRPVAVVCGSGYRASIAASLLQREQFDEVANVVGGMAAWKASQLPMVRA